MGREKTNIVRWDKWADKKKTEQREREKKKEKGVFRFSLRSKEIRPSVFVGARGKVHLCDECYTWGTKIWEFRQTPRGREFSYLDYSNYKPFNGIGFL